MDTGSCRNIFKRSVDCQRGHLDQLESLCKRLSELPMRGHVPPELERIGVKSYREVHFKPYRVLCEVAGLEVYVHCVLDGRRDMQSLIERRLLR